MDANKNSRTDVWLEDAEKVISLHFDEREEGHGNEQISLLVIHNISLPPASKESDFNNCYVEDFFTGSLDYEIDPYFQKIKDIRVSSHLYIKRNGKVVQFVPLNKRAWHAGVSEFNGRIRCNDFSIGIEMQGTDDMAYTDLQYQALAQVTKKIQQLYPMIIKERIVGHQHISPGRKTDPGQSFDWTRYKNAL